jgi:hypothetical protein
MELRLGQILVQREVLTTRQVEQVLARQQRTGEPFGVIAEQLFGIDPESIEDAWADQYARLTRRIDPRLEPIDLRALELVTRRQAWQFRILPVRFDGNELMLATTRRHLRRALRFATNVIGIPVFLVLADGDALGESLCAHYPLPGLTPSNVDDEALERLVRSG